MQLKKDLAAARGVISRLEAELAAARDGRMAAAKDVSQAEEPESEEAGRQSAVALRSEQKARRRLEDQLAETEAVRLRKRQWLEELPS